MTKYRIATIVPVRLELTVIADSEFQAEGKAEQIAKGMQPLAGYLPSLPHGVAATWPKPRDWDWELPEVTP